MFTRKKIQAFVMLLAVVAPLLFFAIFLVQQKLIENNMGKKLETTPLQTVAVNPADIQWVKENKEVVIDGKLFDIASYAVKGDQIILTGLYDSDEDGLHEEFSNFVQQKNESSSPLSNAVIKFPFPPLYNNSVSPLCQNTWQHISPNFFPGYQEKTAEKHCSAVSPPPKFI